MDFVIDSFSRASRGETVQNIIALEQTNQDAASSMRNRLRGVIGLKNEIGRLATIVSNHTITDEIVTAMTGTERPREEREAMHTKLTSTLDWLQSYIAQSRLERILVLTPREQQKAKELLVFLRGIRSSQDEIEE